MAEERLGNEVTKVLEIINSGQNFLLSGGAGSGKTYSLVQILKELALIHPEAQIACITYTNAAAIEIQNRTKIKNLKVSTIHDFLWDTIAPFQKELKQTIIELINDPESPVKNPIPDVVFDNPFDNGIQYREYIRLDQGEISHDEVIMLSHKMYDKYIRLCDLLKDSFQFIFVDEYQDTSPYVVEVLLSFLTKSKKKNVIGFFGDSMQAIYDDSIGDLETYISDGRIIKVEKEQNRRNPKAVISLANKLRLDGLEQKHSNDNNAPNMLAGTVKPGNIKFLYSNEFNLADVRASRWCDGWNFSNPKETKELRLTHNLIAEEAGFMQLMEVYDSDPISKFKQAFGDEVKKKGHIVNENDSFGSVIDSIEWLYKSGNYKGRRRKDVFLEDTLSMKCYEYVKKWPYQKVAKIYLDKDNLIDDKLVIDGITVREPKRDRLIQHLFKIQDIISLYQEGNYNEIIRKTTFRINSIADKKALRDIISHVDDLEQLTINEVIDYANTTGLCIKDDRLSLFLDKNEYLYWRIKDIPFKVFKQLYLYLEGFAPFSTQHKIKGLEFDNVLVVLHNGDWSKYNFEYLFDVNIFKSLTKARQGSYQSILSRTKKLFYVCCTRARENLVIFYPNSTPNVLAGANALFGKDNCVNLDV